MKNDDELRESRKRVSARLSEALETRRRLARLRKDYVLVERSRFSRLRTLWLVLKSLFGLGSKDRFATISGSSAIAALPAGERGEWATAPSAQTQYAEIAETFRQRTPKSPAAEPIVSIVIPVYNHCAVTMRCLRSIVANWFDTLTTEIIVVDDCSSDETAAALATIPGISVVRNAVNQGFIRSCNRGAALASGRYLCFLNNDTEVTPAWLDYLVSTADSDSSIGAVGAKLVYPGGSLQEAGSIIWRDASGWNYGRNDNPADPLYNFVRQADYCSGACLLVRNELFRELGGFSQDLVPAYYEDADLCFAIRERGYKVLCDPRSVVVHHEGVSSGTSTTSGTKRYQDINKPKFELRWRHVLADHYENDPANVYRAARRMKPSDKTILVIDSYVPMHDREAGSLRLYEIVKMLLRAGNRVVFQPDNWTGLEPYTGELQGLGVEVVYHVNGERTPQERLREMLPHVNVAWVSRPQVLEKWLPALREYPQIRVLYDTVDLHHVRMRRQAEFEGNTETAPWKTMEALELKCARDADGTITVTAEEKATLEIAGIRPVYVIPTIHNANIDGPRRFSDSKDLLFIGGYGHLPNVGAVRMLCEDIMPIVWRSLPEVRVTLLGNNPPPEVLKLQSDQVYVTGFVADVAPYFLSHRLFVAPLRFGAGIKGKIGHSLSYGLPTITSKIGAEGFGLRDGHDFLRAEGAQEFADAIVRLYTDERLWSQLSANSIAALRPFSSAALTGVLLEAVDSAKRADAHLKPEGTTQVRSAR